MKEKWKEMKQDFDRKGKVEERGEMVEKNGGVDMATLRFGT